MIHCRIFLCRLCKRIIAGCVEHADAIAEYVDCCAICKHNAPKPGRPKKPIHASIG